MGDLFESELRDRAEIERLNELVKSLLATGGRVASQLRLNVENGDIGNLSHSQEYLNEWDQLVIQADGDWLSKVINTSECVGTIHLG